MSVTATLAAVWLFFAMEPSYQIESVRVSFTHYDQTGIGYQSAAGPVGQPGSERITVEQPQAAVIATLGDRVVQTLWLPVDAVTAASPDHNTHGRPIGYEPPDAITSASRNNLAGTLDSLTRYRWDRQSDISFRASFHKEEHFESWAMGAGGTRSFADDNTVVDTSLHQAVDWFDRFDIHGNRYGSRASRSTTNANLGVTQLWSPTTVAAVSYGGTLQLGTLVNTWSSVLLSNGDRGEENMPRYRQRHALSARIAQWLPWQGALKVNYRAYVDDWGIGAHTVQTDLAQRLAPWLHARATYRYHRQGATRYFTTSGDPDNKGFQTADSDLARFAAHTIGGALAMDLSFVFGLRDLHLDIGYDHYQRSNNLAVHIVTCSLGLRF